jgi:MFS family permease
MHAMPDSVEGAMSWRIAIAATVLTMIGFGTPYVVIVALKPIAAQLGSPRSVPALANSLASFGAGVGGIAMGWWADRVGVFWTALFGAVMVGLGAMVSSGGTVWQLYLGHGLMIGLLGTSGIFSPLMTHVSRWFDRRRGVALSLVASGQQVAGAIWPPIFGSAIEAVGWQRTLFWYGAIAIAAMIPLTFLLRARPPAHMTGTGSGTVQAGAWRLSITPRLALLLLSAAIVCCCVPMAMPMVHLVAFCSDLGYAPARGTEMLSVLLGAAFLSRLFWGRLSDRIGGLKTILFGSACQAVALALFMAVRNLEGLYALSAAFGLGFSGIVPAYVLAVRDLFPSTGAGWRIGIVLFSGLAGMAAGGWLAGAIYDWAGFYDPAFAVGVAFNLFNLLFVGWLIRSAARAPAARAA